MIRKKLGIYFIFCLLASVLVSSCAYPISQEYRKEAKPGPTFAMVFNNPDQYKGYVVIWGGMIIKTINTEKGSMIYVLETPLGFMEKPEATEYSQGRFIAETQSYIDPLVYRHGKRVTMAGVVTGSMKVTGRNKKLTYTYPVIQIKQVKLWERRVYYYNPYYPYYPYYHYYNGWGYWPYWYGYGGFGFEGEEGEGDEFEGGEGGDHFEGGEGEEGGERGGGRR